MPPMKVTSPYKGRVGEDKMEKMYKVEDRTFRLEDGKEIVVDNIIKYGNDLYYCFYEDDNVYLILTDNDGNYYRIKYL